MSCPYTGPNLTLTNICSCKQQIEDLSGAIKSYQDTLATNSALTTKYNEDSNNYKQAKSTWDTNRQNRKNELLGERQNQGGCGVCPNAWNTGCNGGWDHDSTHGCNALGCERSCKRSNSQAEQDLGPWLSQNPEPQAPIQPSFKTPDQPINNIQCCGVAFTGLTSNTLTFSEIEQKCGTTPAGSAGSSGSTSSTGSTGSSADSKTKYYIIGAVVLIVMMLLSGLLLMVSGDGDE